MPWRFYVYALKACDAVTAYIGKGSGRRLQNQIRAFGLPGEIIACCKSERDAYAVEREKISELKPLLNWHPGGNGSWAIPEKPYRKDKWDLECDRIGTRAMSARICLRYFYMFDQSEVEALRRVAYG
jgi:hypothetical protein